MFALTFFLDDASDDILRTNTSCRPATGTGELLRGKNGRIYIVRIELVRATFHTSVHGTETNRFADSSMRLRCRGKPVS